MTLNVNISFTSLPIITLIEVQHDILFLNWHTDLKLFCPNVTWWLWPFKTFKQNHFYSWKLISLCSNCHWDIILKTYTENMWSSDNQHWHFDLLYIYNLILFISSCVDILMMFKLYFICHPGTRIRKSHLTIFNLIILKFLLREIVYVKGHC